MDPPHRAQAARLRPDGVRVGDPVRRRGRGPARDQADGTVWRAVRFPATATSRSTGQRSSPASPPARSRPTTMEASWELTFADEHEPFRHLPYDFLYGAPLPKTKFLSPYPAARFTGKARIGDRDVDVVSWPGMVGHNWGAEHAERWVWIEGASFDGDETGDGFFDMAVGRIKVGRNDDPVGRQRGPLHRRTAPSPRRLRPDPLDEGLRPPDRLRFLAFGQGDQGLGRGRLRARRTSSPGSTPIPTAPSTTRSTARSRTWS